MQANQPKTSFIGIKFEAEPRLAGRVVQAYSDIRMRVVSSSGYDSLSFSGDQFVPFSETLIRSPVEVREQEIGITAIRPESIKEHHEWIDPSRVRVNIIDFDAFITCRFRTLELLRISYQLQARRPTR